MKHSRKASFLKRYLKEPQKELLIKVLFSLVVVLLIALAFVISMLKEKAPEERAVRRVPAKKVVKVPAVAIVLDDFGYSKKNLEAIKKAGVPLTLAILPEIPYSKEVAKYAVANGFESILHMPMEPEKQNIPLEKLTLKTGSDLHDLVEMLSRAFKSVPGVKGLSNHMGSKATKDRRLMTVVMDDLKKRGMYFLDSYTSGESVCKEKAAEAGIPYVRRNFFIDNDNNPEYIRRKFDELGRLALSSDKWIVAIGHDRKTTIDILNEKIPELKRKGIKFVLVSDAIARER